MDLWFAVSPDNEKNFDRLAMLKAALFDIFADHNRVPAVLDYVEMVSNCEKEHFNPFTLGGQFYLTSMVNFQSYCC